MVFQNQKETKRELGYVCLFDRSIYEHLKQQVATWGAPIPLLDLPVLINLLTTAETT